MAYPSDGDNPSGNTELRRRVETLILNGELYFPTAVQLNDPFEARPHFLPVNPDPSITRRALKKGLRERFAPAVGLSEEELREYESRTDLVDPSEIAAGLAAKWLPKFRTEFPMCCFASNREHILMWSHYAGGHSGVAVHFDSTRVPFGASNEVTYSSTYPKVPVPFLDTMTADEMTALCLLTKSDHWRHEGEYRFINYPLDSDDPRAGRTLSRVFQWLTDQRCIVPAELITGITLGAAMPPEMRARVSDICATRTPALPVSQADCDVQSFSLVMHNL